MPPCAAALQVACADFDQLWLVQERGFERSQIAIIGGLFACFAGVAGNLFGGVGADFMLRATGLSRPTFLALLILVIAPFNLAFRLIEPSTFLFWFCMALSYFQLGAFYGPTFATVQQLAPATVRSSAVAFYIMALNVVGLGIGVTGSGLLVDALKREGMMQPYSWALFAFTCLSLFSVPLYLLAARSMRTP